MNQVGNFINGCAVFNSDSNTADVFNPATGDVCALVQLSSAEETTQIIGHAESAFEKWKRVTPLNRARILFKFKSKIEEHIDELATIITREHGKVFSDAKGEIIRGLEVVEFACGIPHLLKGEHSLNVGRGVDSFSLMQPLGVCAGITPFNFPTMVPMWMFPVALACGNTMIMKPSEKDPSALMFIAELLKQSGLPDGVFNIVNGDKLAVDTLLDDERVKAISFVGSTPIAEYIYSRGSEAGKRVQALGGAKNHLVVAPDADIDLTVKSLLGAAYGSAGERCMAISVAVCIGEDVETKLINRLREEIDHISVGNGLDDNCEPDMGPVITNEHKQKIIDYISIGVDEGAELVIDGRDYQVENYSAGFFVGPTLFNKVQQHMKIYKEEIFGPVLCVMTVNCHDEAIKLINAHEFGNGTSIFTSNGRAAREFSEQIEVGMVGINVPIPVPMAFHCFGGWKKSAFGPLNMHGPDGVRFYTKMKTVTSRWPDTTKITDTFVMPTMK